MKKSPKLSLYISIVLGLITIIMIFFYSYLVQFSLFSGIEETATFGTHLAARDFELEYQKNPNTPLPETKYIKGYLGEKDLPEWFKERHPMDTRQHATAIMDDMDNPKYDNGEPFFYLAFPYDLQDGKRLYIIEKYTENDEIEGTFKNSEKAEIYTLALGIGFIILIFFTLRYLFYKVSDPVENLLKWAGNLTQNNLENTHPNFKFKEINHLADLIENAISDLNLALNREHDFLRNASHELRTPIAILKTNSDLLERLRSNPEKRERVCYERIRRAVDNMQSLTETLLWLSRKEEKMPESEPVKINKIVEELVAENQYLLDGKNVKLDLKTVPVKETFPKAALRIVFSNLIRNAFQYTHQGKVTVKVTTTSVTIANENQATQITAKTNNEYGFGLGLMLVEQTCKKLNLTYKAKAIPKGHEASIFFKMLS